MVSPHLWLKASNSLKAAAPTNYVHDVSPRLGHQTTKLCSRPFLSTYIMASHLSTREVLVMRIPLPITVDIGNTKRPLPVLSLVSLADLDQDSLVWFQQFKVASKEF